MATQVNPRLLKRLQQRLRSRSNVYRHISRIVNSRNLPRHIAALALAVEHDIGIAPYASEEELERLQGTYRPGLHSAGWPSGRTPDLIPSPSPASPAAPRQSDPRPARPRPKTSVWIVHGRDEIAKEAVDTFLGSIGVTPLEWNEADAATGEGSASIQKILNKAFKKAAAVLVLLTPDDEARLHRRFSRPGEDRQLAGQPRLNVIFEAGMALATHQKQTVFVEIGAVRPFSNIAGLHVVRMRDDAAKRRELATKLQSAGLKVNLDGTRWTTAGNFAAALAAVEGRRPKRRRR